MKRNKLIEVKGIAIGIKTIDSQKYISLTDIAKKKNSKEPRFVIINWLRNRNTVEFLGIWEKIYNSNFNRVGFDTVRLNTGLNSFTISPSKWINDTNAIGIISKSGRYESGTYAHEDIALEFASWISPEFKLYFIKEFRRLKYAEKEKLKLYWNLKRELVKINYKIHTGAIKENLMPPEISTKDAKIIYATEADVLNKALFGMTAKEWSNLNPAKKGNMRDYADVRQLVCLANLENLNALFIEQKMGQAERLTQLNKIAISRMKSLLDDPTVKKLEGKK